MFENPWCHLPAQKQKQKQGLLPVIGVDIPKADTRKCTTNATQALLHLNVVPLAPVPHA